MAALALNLLGGDLGGGFFAGGAPALQWSLGAVLRLTAIPGTFAVGLTSMYGPRFAKLWVARNLPALRSTLRETQLWMTGLYLPFALAFVVFPALVTDQLGSDFQGSANALRIMGVAQLINALTGQAPMMLSMCRDEVQALVRAAWKRRCDSMPGGIV